MGFLQSLAMAAGRGFGRFALAPRRHPIPGNGPAPRSARATSEVIAVTATRRPHRPGPGRAIRILRYVKETLVLVLQALFPHPDALRPRPAADAPAERHAHRAPVLEYSRPDSDGPGAGPDGARSRRSWYVTPIGGMVRRGRWSVERRLVFIAVIGGMNLDLREAQLTAPEVVVTAVSVIGGLNLIVPPGSAWRLITSASSVAGTSTPTRYLNRTRPRFGCVPSPSSEASKCVAHG